MSANEPERRAALCSADDDLARGRVWVLVLAANLFAPVWAFWLKSAH